MSSRPSKPRWGLAYSLGVLLLLLLGLIERLPLSSPGKQIAQIASVLLTFGLLYLWVWANAHALNEEWRQKAEQKPSTPLPTPGQRHFRRVMQFHHLARRTPPEEDASPTPSRLVP